MQDHKSKTFLQDSRRIDIDEPYQLGYWSKLLNCSHQQLKDAVAAVGSSVAAVWKHLEGKRA